MRLRWAYYTEIEYHLLPVWMQAVEIGMRLQMTLQAMFRIALIIDAAVGIQPDPAEYANVLFVGDFAQFAGRVQPIR